MFNWKKLSVKIIPWRFRAIYRLLIDGEHVDALLRDISYKFSAIEKTTTNKRTLAALEKLDVALGELDAHLDRVEYCNLEEK